MIPRTLILPSVLSVALCACGKSETKTDSSSNETGTSETGQTDTSPKDTNPPEDTGPLPADQYCVGNDPELANCSTEQTFDPWIAAGGEIHYWIRDKKTEVFPFTVDYESLVWYGYFQITSGETKREKTEDVFHVWFSETPNGPPLEGNGCEWYTTRAQGMVYWVQGDVELGDQMCDIGTERRILYANFEPRCYPGTYEGLCDDDNKQKSDRTYQFDVSRRYKLKD